jgi:hypothetical protein
MKLWGKNTLPKEFTWTPNQLLEMIREVDKICPEEGTVDLQTSDHRHTTVEKSTIHE